ncbi:MAG TPA: hypothetical protein VNE39_27880 [Planctomycetota bacterium]|nr:hypothetical protein [Planctomycetota bacterium]
MLAHRLALALLCAPLASIAHAADGSPESPPVRRALVTVFPVSKRPQEHLVAPGEWMVIADQHSLWMPHYFEGTTPQVFRKRGAEVYLIRPPGKEQLVGVQMKSLTGRLELRSALATGANPLTIWPYASVLPEIPALPPGRRYALAVDGVSDLRPLTRLRELSALKLGCAPGVVDLSPLAELTRLESLWLSGASADDLSPLAALPRLRVLRIDLCKAITDLTPLTRLKNLRVLDFDCSGALANAAPLAKLRQLNVLVLRRCPGLLDLAPMTPLDELTWLGVHGSPLVADLTPLRHLSRLTTIELEGCPNLTDLTPLAGLARLEAVSLRACPRLADISPLATLTRLSRMEVLDCPRVMDLWPLRRAARQPDHFSVDWRVSDESSLAQHASPGKVTLVMDGRYVSAVAMPPEALGEDDGWGNILSRSLRPPPGLAGHSQELPYPVAGHRPDSVLNFTLEGLRVFLSGDRGPRKLVGIIACSPAGIAEVRRAVAEGASPLILWADAASVEHLPPLPPGRDYTLVILDIQAPIKPLARVENLTGLYLAHASTSTSNLAPIAHLTGLKTLVLRETPRADSLKPLARMTGLTSLDLSLSRRVRDLKPLAKLTKLTTLRLSCPRHVDFSPLASLPALSELILETGDQCTDLSSLGNLKNLRTLSLRAHHSAPGIGFLANLTQLKAVRLCGLAALTDLAPLTGLGSLEVVIFRSCNRLRDLRPLASLPALRYLDITTCPGAADIPILRHFQARNVQLVLDTHIWPQLARARLDLTQAAEPAVPERQ